MHDDNSPKMRTIPQISKEFDIPGYTLRRLCKNGTIPHIKSGNRPLINATMLADILSGKQGTYNQEVS